MTDESEKPGKERVGSNAGQFPASAPQRRLWYLDQLNPGSPAYNMSQAFRLSGSIDIVAIQRSVDEVVSRHAPLRTTFQTADHKPVQNVAESIDTQIRFVDLSSNRTEAGAVELQQIIDAEVRQSFNLESGPLFRTALIRLHDDDHLLLFIEHHIIFDRTSEGLLLREFSAFYARFTQSSSESKSIIEEVSNEYSDYALWREETAQSDSDRRSLAYWKEKLGDLQPLELPTDSPRSASLSSNGNRQYLQLNSEDIESLAKLASSKGATLFMALAAVVQSFLHLWTGEEDIAFGTPFADRRMPGTKHLLGFFVNHLVLRTDVSDDPSFLQLLSRTRKVCFGAYRNSAPSFERIVEVLQPSRELNRNPLYDVEFAYQPAHGEPMEMAGVGVEVLTASKGTSQYDMTITVRERPNGHDLRIEYRTDLFDAETIRRVLHRIGQLLAEIVKDPTRPLSNINLTTPDELQKLLIDWNQTRLDYPDSLCLHELFERQAERSAERIALRCQDQSITYRELDENSNRLARHLADQGVGTETFVAICVERSIEMVTGLLAIMKAGGAYIPLDHSYPAERLAHMLEDSDATVLVTTSKLLSELPQHNAREVLLDTHSEAIAAQSLAKPHSTVTPENVAYLIYTSGSTGKPKGVQIEHRNVVNFLASMKERPGITEDDVLLAVTTLSFDIAVLELYLPLMVGAQTVVASHDAVVDGDQLRQQIDRFGVTIMQATPVSWRLLLAANWSGSNTFKILCGGEAMPKDLAAKLLSCSGELWNMYGPTETTVWSTCHRIENAADPILIGKPIGNTSIFILDQAMRPAPIGMVGELYIGGDGVARGYLNRPGLNAERFVTNPFAQCDGERLYRTGDGARYRQDGSIEYQNRLDNQVKVRGNRIELGEIEATIAGDTAIRQTAVIVREDVKGDPRIVAYFELKAGMETSQAALRERLRSALPSYMIPQFLIPMESMPVTPNGKINRKALPIPKVEDVDSGVVFVAPRNASETLLAHIWQEILDVDQIGVHDNFVELGGHSLLALQVISRVRQETGKSISPVSMIMGSLEQIALEFSGEQIAHKPGENIQPTGIRIEPFYFGRKDQQLFGLYHVPAETNRKNHAVLVCPPVFIEGIRAQWALKRLADQLAQAGYDVMRFDYFGTGDSLGDGEDATAGLWQDDIRAAAVEIRSRAKTSHLSIVGLRFGATLATTCNDIDCEALLLWDPVFDPTEFIAELDSKHQLMLADANTNRHKNIVEEDYELLGFRFPPALRESISDIRIDGQNPPNSQRVSIIVSSAALRPVDAVTRDLGSAGADVAVKVVEDASCAPDDRGELSAFLPSPILRAVRDEVMEDDR
ncbi:MAG: amino acid adenylation domain-containing protein [Gammaproteobacteria bacterium]|nr:amino acid adenylation domain-containing protein [Gammaproteobacteria bacterium]